VCGMGSHAAPASYSQPLRRPISIKETRLIAVMPVRISHLRRGLIATSFRWAEPKK